MLEIKPVPAFRDNYIWLIINSDGNETAVVDPGDAGPVLEQIRSDGLKPRAILTTHHHPDHVGGVAALLEHFSIPVYGPAGESIPARTHALREGDRVDLPELGIHFDILDVPGHTAGAIAYHGPGVVFTGDTLFMAGCGRLFEGTPEQMHQSLGKLSALPPETLVYCAHEYTLANLDFALTVEPENDDIRRRMAECREQRLQGTPTVPASLAVEKLTNPFLRAHVAAVRTSAAQHSGSVLQRDTDVFAAVRAWKDQF